jgi:hypothetical protein
MNATQSLGWKSRILPSLLPILVALLFVAVVLYFFPFREVLQLDSDEGFNLMKALVLNRGYPLYDQIWSDQPPLLTYYLVMVFRLAGMSVDVARLSILLLSAVLVWAAFQTTHIIGGTLHGIVTVILIMLLPSYMRLSVSVMVGLPSLAFAMASLWGAAAWYQERRYAWVVFSALAMGVSVFIKLFTGFLAPILVLALLAIAFFRPRSQELGERSYRQMALPAVLWTGIFGAFSALVLLVLVGPGNIGQLLGAHLAGISAIRDETFTINYYLQDSKPLLLLAFLGFLQAMLGRKWMALAIAGWMAAAYLLLRLHSPVWYHHQLLVTLPAAMLGGVGMGEALRGIWGVARGGGKLGLRFFLGWVTLAGFALVLYDQIPDISQDLEPGANLGAQIVQVPNYLRGAYHLMEEYAPDTNWVITDRPIVPFRLGLSAPPSMVVFSNKRIQTGFLTEDEVYQALEDYKPEQVLLRGKMGGLEGYLRERYQLVYTHRQLDLYIRNELYAQHQTGP